MVRNINFHDATSGEEAWAGVRLHEQAVGLALSLTTNGDVEVFMDASTVDDLIEALAEARGQLRSG